MAKVIQDEGIRLAIAAAFSAGRGRERISHEKILIPRIPIHVAEARAMMAMLMLADGGVMYAGYAGDELKLLPSGGAQIHLVLDPHTGRETIEVRTYDSGDDIGSDIVKESSREGRKHIMSKELYQEVRNLIVQDRGDVSATVLDALADMMAHEIDKANAPEECVKHALQQAVHYLRVKNLCPDIMRDLEGILETERFVESLTGDPAIDCRTFGNEIERMGRAHGVPIRMIEQDEPPGDADEIVDASFVANDNNADKPS